MPPSSEMTCRGLPAIAKYFQDVAKKVFILELALVILSWVFLMIYLWIYINGGIDHSNPDDGIGNNCSKYSNTSYSGNSYYDTPERQKERDRMGAKLVLLLKELALIGLLKYGVFHKSLVGCGVWIFGRIAVSLNEYVMCDSDHQGEWWFTCGTRLFDLISKILMVVAISAFGFTVYLSRNKKLKL